MESEISINITAIKYPAAIGAESTLGTFGPAPRLTNNLKREPFTTKKYHPKKNIEFFFLIIITGHYNTP